MSRGRPIARPAIPHALARIVDQPWRRARTPAKRRIRSAKELATLLAPFAISERVPSARAPQHVDALPLAGGAPIAGLARLERAVLGMGEQKPSNVEKTMFVIEGAQDKVAKISERPTEPRLPSLIRSTPRISNRAEDPPRTPHAQTFGRLPRPPRR